MVQVDCRSSLAATFVRPGFAALDGAAPSWSRRARSPGVGAWWVVVVCAFAVFGCGGEAPPATGPGADAVDADVGAGEVTDPFEPCADNVDCAGGEVCREGLCREACTEDADCDGALRVCDEIGGLCVACLADGDCGADARCEDQQCVFWCEVDAACPQGQVCDDATGTCVESECTEPVDCPGGFDCRDSLCVPIDPVICTPLSSRCAPDGQSVIACGRDGTSETTAECEPDAVCVESGDTAACVDRECEPLVFGCLDDWTAFVCDQSGTELSELPCRDDSYCEAGVCRVQVCEAGVVQCDGNVVVSCDERGAAVALSACAEAEGCVGSAAGCVCLDGACQTRVCVPGSGRCTGNAGQVCRDDGLGYGELSACTSTQVCVAGACLDLTCEPGSRQCVGDRLLTCNSDGTSRAETDCAASGRICTGSGASSACTARVCAPDSVVCDDTARSVLRCDARGANITRTDCSDGTYCSGGVCLAQVCVPGTGNTCVAGNVQRCNADGSAWVLVDACDRSTERCAGGACADMVCMPGSERCSGETLVVCSDDGLRETRTDCATSGGYCDASGPMCSPRVCVPSASRCDGNRVVTCDARGSAETTTATCSATLGCAAGSCVVGCGDGVVQEGEQCDDGNLLADDGCGADCRREIIDGYVVIPAGSFTMGAPFSEAGRGSDEVLHAVTLTRRFLMKVTEVTQSEWTALSGGVNPSCFQQTAGIACSTGNANPDGPVERVDWYSALAFANALSRARGLEECYTLTSCTDPVSGWVDGSHAGCTGATFAGLDCTGYRLPTEAEWEYAARAGTSTATPLGNLSAPVLECSTVQPNLDPVAWWCRNASSRTQAISTRAPNPWGLYDMLGNVWEWTWDRHGAYEGAATDPLGPDFGTTRVVRGGDWQGVASEARAAKRERWNPGYLQATIGFRLARTAF